MSETALQLFRKACGLSAPLALVCQDASSQVGAYTPLEYARPFMLIGRQPTADLLLNHDQVSRRHAYLQAIVGRVYCIDLASRSKTFWHGHPDARSQGWLDSGQFIQVGPYRIHRTDRPADLEQQAPVTNPLAGEGVEGSHCEVLPRVALELPFRAGGQSSTWTVGGLLTLVGRSTECQLELNDKSVSQYHACLIRTPLGLWVTDLAAREGVHVNGTRVRWSWLADGDLVRLGLFTLVVRYETLPEGISRQDVPLEAGASPSGPIIASPSVASEPAVTNRRSLAIRSRGGPLGRTGARQPQHLAPRSAPISPIPGEWEPVFPPGPGSGAMWQQQVQLMETFHNEMIMMVQMFIAMHRESLSSVRGELDRVQQLTQELNLLNAKLGQGDGSGEAGPASETGRRRSDTAELPHTHAPVRNPDSLPSASERKSGPSRPGPSEKVDDARPSRRPGTKRDDPKRRRPDAPAPEFAAAELYANLTRRITELQRERQGYWQKILKAING
jgi:pSer/pThr/pTyr-binding forkhead associated (FHA) protein